MISHLETSRQTPNSGLAKRRPKGWTPERRARQAALIRGWQPWRRSTGPRSDPGKARSAMNAIRHGFRSRAYILKLRRVRNAIRLCARTVALVRASMRNGTLAATRARITQTPEETTQRSAPSRYSHGNNDRLHPQPGE